MFNFRLISPANRRALIVAVLQYPAMWALMFLFMQPDPGIADEVWFRSWGFAFVAHFVGSLIVIFRRPGNPSRIDLLFIKYGFMPLFGVAFQLSKSVMIAKGFSPGLFF